jgi:hypothetical protein
MFIVDSCKKNLSRSTDQGTLQRICILTYFLGLSLLELSCGDTCLGSDM